MTYLGTSVQHGPTLVGFGDGREIYTPYGIKKDNATPTILGFHGHGAALGLEVLPATYETPDGYVQACERGFCCYNGNWGGNLWGNDVQLALIDAAVTHLHDVVGAKTSKVHLYAVSMGAAAALNWAKRNPSKVASIVLAAPAVNLSRLHDQNVNGFAEAEINTAYTNAAGWTAAKATRDPCLFGADLAGIPIKVFYSLADTTVVPADVTTFRSVVGSSCEIESLAGDPIHANALAGWAWVQAFMDAHPIP